MGCFPGSSLRLGVLSSTGTAAGSPSAASPVPGAGMAQPLTPGQSPQSHDQPGRAPQRIMKPFRLEKTSQITRGVLLQPLSARPAQSPVSPCFWGWVSRSPPNTAHAFLGATTRGVAWVPQPFLPTAAPGAARPAAGFGPGAAGGWLRAQPAGTGCGGNGSSCDEREISASKTRL